MIWYSWQDPPLPLVIRTRIIIFASLVLYHLNYTVTFHRHGYRTVQRPSTVDNDRPNYGTRAHLLDQLYSHQQTAVQNHRTNAGQAAAADVDRN